MSKKIKSKILIRILFLLVVFSLLSNQLTALVQVDPPLSPRDFTVDGVYYSLYNNQELYTVNKSINFSQIIIDDPVITFNTTGFEINAPNQINVTIDFINGSIVNASLDDLLVRFWANTSGGTVHFNLSGFNSTNQYLVNRSGILIGNPIANGTGVIHFSNAVWSEHLFTIYRGNYTPAADNWTVKPGYDNCTWGPPDFDQKQDMWDGINPFDGVSQQWYMCGPVALANCFWWLDCKLHNTSHDYLSPDFCGLGSKHPDNVIPLIDWIAGYLNTTMPMGIPFEHSGTSAENMTKGIYGILNNDTIEANDTINVTVDGYHSNFQDGPGVNYTNITWAVDDCSDVVLLIGFWCEVEPGAWIRRGGHYLQVSGYCNDYPALRVSDPYYDRAEDGYPGWNSTHDHSKYGNGSHNWTVNVSYDYYNVSLTTSGPSIGDWYILNNYFKGTQNGSNWTGLNWWDECYEDIAPCVNSTPFLEIAWFIREECCIETNKTVWNESSNSWVKHLPYSYVNSTTHNVTFNISWHCCGDCGGNISVYDTLYTSLRYINDSAVVHYPDGTTESKNPDVWSKEADPYHEHAQWNFTEDNVTMDPCQTMYIIFNASMVASDISWNNVTVYVIPPGIPDHQWWDSDCWNASSCSVGDYPLAYQLFNCTCNESEKSCWNVTEYFRGGTFDEVWLEYEPAEWNLVNLELPGNPDWGYCYRYGNDIGNQTNHNHLSYSIANTSCSNRTQSLVRMRINTTEESDRPVAGVVYRYENYDRFDMVLYGDDTVYALSVINGILVNTEDYTPVTTFSDCINYYRLDWVTDPDHYDAIYPYRDGPYNGTWIKTIYNEYPGTLLSKAWSNDEYDFDRCEEPTGWCLNETWANLVYNNASCFGLVIWNPENYTFVADFDMIDMWRLNYSRDPWATPGQLANHSNFGNDGIPIMYFPVFNYSHKVENWTQMNHCYDEWMVGNITYEEYIICSEQSAYNISNDMMSMESRAYNPNVSVVEAGGQWWDQNDSIYYYTSIVENMSGAYSAALLMQIEDCTDGSQNNFDGAVVCIDVDNDMSWDSNDVAVTWWSFLDIIWQTNKTCYLGNTTNPTIDDIDTVAMFDDCVGGMFEGSFPPLHRYESHRSYFLEIPLVFLEKGYTGSGDYLNVNDTFGLHVMTINRGQNETWTLSPVWTNWNETSNDHYIFDDTEPTNHLTIWDYFMNCSTDVLIKDFCDGLSWNGVNFSNIRHWGHGRILNNTGWDIIANQYSINVTKEGNVSSITDITKDNLVNYTITVCNDGNDPITNVTVNDTLPLNCVYVDSSLPGANVTGSDRNWTFNVTHHLSNGSCLSFNVTINVTAGAVPNGTNLNNTVNASCDNFTYGSGYDLILYGSNNLPVINWQYPSNTSMNVTIVLANISVGVYDNDGDNLDIYFTSNKTRFWNGTWRSIGVNLSVPNGTYSINKSIIGLFNMTNTPWRWGNTVYYWNISVTDGKAWVNESYWYDTTYSRYNVNIKGAVNVFDLSADWAHETGTHPYDGLYDVNGNGAVNVFDLSAIWGHHT